MEQSKAQLFLEILFIIKIVSNYYIYTNLLVKNIMLYIYKRFRPQANYVFLILKKCLTAVLFSFFYFLVEKFSIAGFYQLFGILALLQSLTLYYVLKLNNISQFVVD